MNLSELLHTLYDTRHRKSALEREEKSLIAELKPLVDAKFDSFPGAPIFVDGLTLTRAPGETRMIVADLLLERGVSPEIVAYATKTTPFFQYRVKGVR